MASLSQYQYRVISFRAAVTAGEVASGKADAKVSAQLESQLAALSAEGYEYYNQIPIDVKIKKGCFGGSNLADEVTLVALLFRKEIR